MKTAACLLVIVAALPISLHGESVEMLPADGRPADRTIPKRFASLKREDPTQPLGLVEAERLPAMPAEALDLAREAREQFARGNFREAEELYDKALTIAPDNVYLLANKGVVLLRQQKYTLAEETFKKAVAIAPRDDFCQCTLGIVEYQLGKLDAAINNLTKALAINPKNTTTHNYLGIIASQKGWHEAARKELETALARDPTYADAHFNLAIVFSTLAPPNKKAAREHYARAIELGAKPNSELEQMIK